MYAVSRPKKTSVEPHVNWLWQEINGCNAQLIRGLLCVMLPCQLEIIIKGRKSIKLVVEQRVFMLNTGVSFLYC